MGLLLTPLVLGGEGGDGEIDKCLTNIPGHPGVLLLTLTTGN